MQISSEKILIQEKPIYIDFKWCWNDFRMGSNKMIFSKYITEWYYEMNRYLRSAHIAKCKYIYFNNIIQ